MKRIFTIIDNKNGKFDLKNKLRKIHNEMAFYYPHLHHKALYIGCVGELSEKPKSEIFEKSGISLLFQGNLFYKSKYRTNEEFIINLYKKYNDLSFLRQLNGSFNFILYDSDKKLLFVISDKYASRPLYWYNRTDQFIVASEVKIITSTLNKKQPINWSAWGQYLTFRYTLSNNTFFKNINIIEPATIITCDLSKTKKFNKSVRIAKYWSYSKILTDYKKSEVEMIEEGVGIFKRTFSKLGELILNKKTIIPLSGGYDSRGIVSSLAKFSRKKDFDTLTTIHPAGPEDAIAKMVAEKMGIRNKYINRPKDIYQKYFIKKSFLTDSLVQEHLWAMPMLDVIQHYDTYIDGIAGDIILRSTRVRPVHIEKQKDSLYLAKLFKKQLGYDFDWLKEYINPLVWKKIKYTPEWAKECFDEIDISENRFVIFLMKYRIRNCTTTSPNNMIGSQVQNVIQPYLNDELVSFGLSIPHKYKFDGIYRKILDKAFPELISIKSTSDIDIEKNKEYDQRIIEFNKNPRELIGDYLEVSNTDQEFLFNLFKKLEAPPFIDKSKFAKDYLKSPKFNRLITILDFAVWYNLFVKKKRNIYKLLNNTDGN